MTAVKRSPILASRATERQAKPMTWAADDDYAYSGNEGRTDNDAYQQGGYTGWLDQPAAPGTPGYDASTGKLWTDTYGWCGHCSTFTYHGLWHKACGECLWRWSHYPDTMPPSLARYRADMPRTCWTEACDEASPRARHAVS